MKIDILKAINSPEFSAIKWQVENHIKFWINQPDYINKTIVDCIRCYEYPSPFVKEAFLKETIEELHKKGKTKEQAETEKELLLYLNQFKLHYLQEVYKNSTKNPMYNLLIENKDFLKSPNFIAKFTEIGLVVSYFSHFYNAHPDKIGNSLNSNLDFNYSNVIKLERGPFEKFILGFLTTYFYELQKIGKNWYRMEPRTEDHVVFEKINSDLMVYEDESLI